MIHSKIPPRLPVDLNKKKNQYAKETRIEAEAARKKYLENMLEELKQKTITEEQRKALAEY